MLAPDSPDKADQVHSRRTDRRPADSQRADSRPSDSQADRRPVDSRADSRPSDSQADRRPSDSRADRRPAEPELPVAVFRPGPDERVLVAGPCHARVLCATAGAHASGVAAVFVDPCGALLAIATAPAPVLAAMLADAAPFARLTEQLGATRLYIEVPSGDAAAVGDAVAAALWPMCVATEVLSRI